MIELTSDHRLWRNATLATLDPSRPQPYGLLENHTLIVRNQKIEAIVPDAETPTNAAQCIDLAGRLVTPGLIDCHTHLVFAGNRAEEWEQRLNGLSYQHISAQGGGINATVQATRQSSEAQLIAPDIDTSMRLLSERRLAQLLPQAF